MNQDNANEIAVRLVKNSEDLKYGSVSVCVNLYNGHVVQVVYSTTENTKAPVKKNDDEKSSKR